jgi:hypothetical protein
MKVEDKVKIIKKFKSGYTSALSWNSQMDETINMEGIIRKIYKVNKEERIEVMFNKYFNSKRNYWTYLKESLQLIEEEFPEKWCINPKNDKEDKLIGEYFNKILNTDCYIDCQKWYLHSHNKHNEPLETNSKYSFLYLFIRDGFPEITFEQFKKKFLTKEETNKMKTTRKKLLSIRGKDNCSQFNDLIDQELKDNFQRVDEEEFNLSKRSLDNISRASSNQKELLKSIGLIKELDLFSITTYEEVCKALNEQQIKEITLHTTNGLNTTKVNIKRLLALAKLDQIERLFNQGSKVDIGKFYYAYFDVEDNKIYFSSVNPACNTCRCQVGFFKDSKTAEYVGKTFIDIYRDILE